MLLIWNVWSVAHLHSLPPLHAGYECNDENNEEIRLASSYGFDASQKKENKYQLNMFISCCKIESCKIVPCTSEDEREKFVVCTRVICKFSLYQFHLICCLPTVITNW